MASQPHETPLVQHPLPVWVRKWANSEAVLNVVSPTLAMGCEFMQHITHIAYEVRANFHNCNLRPDHDLRACRNDVTFERYLEALHMLLRNGKGETNPRRETHALTKCPGHPAQLCGPAWTGDDDESIDVTSSLNFSDADEDELPE